MTTEKTTYSEQASEPRTATREECEISMKISVDTAEFEKFTLEAAARLEELGIKCQLVGVALDVQTPAPRYFIGSDNSGHRYAVPVTRRAEFEAWANIPDEDPDGWETPDYAIRIDGAFTFTDPRCND